MFKNIISPVQAWLLSQKRCVGCGTPIDQGTKQMINNQATYACKCKRVYVYDETKKTYRRALLSEI